MSDNHKVIEDVCKHIANGNLDEAKKDLTQRYPFVAFQNAGRSYTTHQKTKIFLRDGFIDRYSGKKMVFPPVLRLISNIVPDEFPFQKNWKMSECHLGYWELLPTIDHITPVARGGDDVEDNWVCTSQLRNSVKSNWLLEELGWSLHPSGCLEDWDGMIHWFISYVSTQDERYDDPYIKSWYNVAVKLAGSRA